MTSEVGKTKFQRFEVGEMLRSAILPHPRNPRMITPKAAKRLKGKMKEIGLIQPVIVNRRTCRLVGGHQRLASRITAVIASQVWSISAGVSVGCTKNIKLVSPSSRATGKRCAGRNDVPSKAFSRYTSEHEPE